MRLPIYPKTHYVMKAETRAQAVESIKEELAWWEAGTGEAGALVEAQRIHQRTMFDLEMIKAIGYCHGIENYSRHFTGRLPGEPPPTLLDYLPRDSLMFIDESTRPFRNCTACTHGDRSRKENLVEYGFRLPRALDNRPLTFEEFEHRVNQSGLRFGDARPLRTDEVGRRGGGADHPADRADRSSGRGPPGEGPDRRPAA